jgi:high-affinity nickel permease
MISLLSSIAKGLFVGMRHATDPDHVIAVGTIDSCEGNRKRASMTACGVGHTLTIVAVGFVMIFLRIATAPWLAMELAVTSIRPGGRHLHKNASLFGTQFGTNF